MGAEIRISDLRFIKRGSQSIELPLGTIDQVLKATYV